MRLLTPPITTSSQIILQPVPVAPPPTVTPSPSWTSRLTDLARGVIGWPQQPRNIFQEPQAQDLSHQRVPLVIDRPTITLPPQYGYSPNDLISFYKSEIVSWLERLRMEQRAYGQPSFNKPKMDESFKLFVDKGLEHEEDYLQQLIDEGRSVYQVPTFQERPGMDFSESHQLTLEAMAAGYDVVFQAALKRGRFSGYADFLIKVDNPIDPQTGKPGLTEINGQEVPFHYEVWDTKLSKSAKPHHILQLMAYAEMLEDLQGIRPQEVAVVVGTGKIERFETDEFFYYYRQIKDMFLEFQTDFDPENMPSFGKGDYGQWDAHIKKLLVERDDLAMVARISKTQIVKLLDAGIKTLTELAQTELDSISGISDSVFQRLKKQAYYQWRSKDQDIPEFEVLTEFQEPRTGLATLPPPDSADVFFDIEGYPLHDNGLEYLLGVQVQKENGGRDFKIWWSDNPEEEKENFKKFVQWAYDRWQANPNMHIYHYAFYEVAVMRRLSKRYGVLEKEVKELLDHNVFVDLYKIVRNGMVVGSHSYSIKYIEHLYRGKREGAVTNAVGSIVDFHHYLNASDPQEKQKRKQGIIDYNEDDCDSTWDLYDFLLDLQQKNNIEFIPPEPPQDAKPDVDSRYDKSKSIPDKDTPRLVERLKEKLANEIKKRSEEGKIGALFGELLKFHAKEDQVRLADQARQFNASTDRLIEDSDALADLTLLNDEPEIEKRSFVFEFSYNPDQETSFKKGDRFLLAGQPDWEGGIHDIDYVEGRVQIKFGQATFKKRGGKLPERIDLIPNSFIPPRQIHDSLYRLAQTYLENPEALPPALFDLLRKNSPRLFNTAHILNPALPVYQTGPIVRDNIYDYREKGSESEISDIVDRMDETTLFIQGPPGSGKSTLSAQVILDLIAKGERVGISGPSHKAINNLLKKVATQAQEQGMPLKATKVGGADSELDDLGVTQLRSSRDLFPHVLENSQLVAGTPWVFASDDAQDQFHTLVVDEAGQVPLAHGVAIYPATQNMIFVGDPKQLAQPTRARHSRQSGDSVFDYYLSKTPGRLTLPAEDGIFLPQSFRMPPRLTEFISQNFYEGRLTAGANTAGHQLHRKSATETLLHSGIYFFGVGHQNNRRTSEEEIDAMLTFIESLKEYQLQDGEGKAPRSIELADIKVVSPYNAQVQLARRFLPEDVAIGTVDKFQGQEAPITLLTLAASEVSNAKSLEFLLNPNRLNVGLSRAQTLVAVFAHPQLTRYRARSLDDWRRLNLLCQLQQEFDSSEKKE